MRILGIDPGLATMGYGVIETNGFKATLIAAGAVITPPDMMIYNRLHHIYTGTKELLLQYQPDDIAFEELFYGHNPTTVINVAAARGCAICACAEHTGNIYEYTPMQIKQAITSNGRADKHQMQYMVKLLLNLPDIIRPDDAADAVAAALTHANAGIHKEQFLMTK